MKIAAFVGHSFLKKDESVVMEITKFLTSLTNTIGEFSWDHAEAAEPKELSAKVLGKIKDKNLFIGICTVKESVIDPNMLEKGLLNKSKLNADANNFQLKTSDWIIQEIGLAKGIGLGRGTDFPIILLVEDGVRDPGGLQGDIEYIPFSREKVSNAFPKLMEMVTALRPRLQQVAEQQVAAKQIEKEVESKDNEQHIPRDHWTMDNYTFAVFRAIIDSDEAEVKKISDSFMLSDLAKEKDKILEFQAQRLFSYHLLRKKDVASELNDLAIQNPKDTLALHHLAKVYEDQGQSDKAAQIYTDLLSRAESNQEKISFAFKTAILYCKQGNQNRADELLFNLNFATTLTKVDEIQLLKAHAKIANERGDAIVFCALSEGALLRDPEDNELRFELAYQYSKLEKDALSAKHYRILTIKNPTESNWNNLGVAYTRLNLDGFGVESHKKSQMLGGTLAVSNLAFKLIEVGFYNQAEELCRNVISQNDCHKNVATALTQIDDKREKEDKEYESLQKISHKDIDFFLKASDAMLLPPPADGQYSYSKYGTHYVIKIEGASFDVDFEYDKTENPLSLTFGGSSTPLTKRYRTNIHGTLIGKCGSFSETTEEADKKYSSILSRELPTKGLLVFSEDMSQVEYFIFDKSKISLNKKLEK